MIRSVLLLAAGLILGAIATYQFGPTRTVAVSPYVWQPTLALSPLPAVTAVGTPPLPVETASLSATSTPTRAPKPKPTARVVGGTARGYASWYDDGPGIYAAAGPVLRRMLGADWRHSRVLVRAAGSSVVVELSDWCACGERHGLPTLLDLSIDAFARLADPGRGILNVGIREVQP